MAENRYLVTSTPHIRDNSTIKKLMFDVIAALCPAALAGIYYFGWRAAALIILSIAACVGFEYLFNKCARREQTIADLSAVVTGLLLSFNLPPTAPFWMPFVGAFVAIVIVKQLFGGLGQNFMNPALGARAFLMAAYTPLMASNWLSAAPLGIDAVTSSTPLTLIKEDASYMLNNSDILNALIGNTAGCIGETCAIALILGGAYLLIKKVISWHIPVTYIATVLILGLVIHRGGSGSIINAGLFEALSGGLMLGAFFMATDYASSPVTWLGRIIFGAGCGLLTVIIRNYGGYPEGVSYSILLLNLCVPLLDKYCAPRVFGTKRRAQA
ncbi:MAG: RnfABCDGE type electron transport complex subunit D [Clostridiales bacterium]|nr:RnfABCDGE type electron transport complex subunit D [Clostridiales bacterium]